MSTKKKHKNQEKFDTRYGDELITEVQYRKQKKQHLKEKRLDRALKTKNINDLIQLDEIDE